MAAGRSAATGRYGDNRAELELSVSPATRSTRNRDPQAIDRLRQRSRGPRQAEFGQAHSSCLRVGTGSKKIGPSMDLRVLGVTACLPFLWRPNRQLVDSVLSHLPCRSRGDQRVAKAKPRQRSAVRLCQWPVACVAACRHIAASRPRVLVFEPLSRARNGQKGSGVCPFQSPTPKSSTMPSKPAK